MKKLFLNMMFAASFLFAAGCLTTSCSDDDDTTAENVDPGTGEEPKPEQPEQEYNPVVAQLPIRWSDKEVDGGTSGVSIKASTVTEDNVIFTLRPGDEIQSYRFDVFPLSVLYNQLLNDKMVGKTADEIDDKIISYMTNTTGSGGYIMNADDPDYAELELDWGNSQFAQAKLVANASYIITAVPCFDKDGMEPAGINMVYVKTASKPLVGDPKVNIDVNATYRGFSVTHYPNDDCHYYYYFASDKTQIQEYIDLCGEAMYGEFMRQAVYEATPSNDPGTYTQNFGQTANANFMITATAIGLDANKTPAKTFQRQDFSLKAIPETAEVAECNLEVNPQKLSSTQAFMNAKLSKACAALFFNIIPKSDAENLKNADEATRLEYAVQLRDGGWGIANKNFAFDEAAGKATGKEYTGGDFLADLDPGTEYMAVYVGRNFYDQLTELKFSEPFSTKNPVEDNPSACKANDLTLEVTDIERNQAKLTFRFNEETLANIRFQYIAPNFTGAMLPMEGDPREDFINLFFAREPFTESSFVNTWYAEAGGISASVDTNLEPGNEYKIAYMAEDWSGVLGDVKFVTFKTLAAPMGDNPQVKIEAKVQDGYYDVKWTTTDAFSLKYATINEQYTEALLDKLSDPKTTYEQMIDAFTYCTVTYGLDASSGKMAEQVEFKEGVQLSLGLAYGKDEKQSALAYAILKDGKVMTLADFGKSPKGATKAAKLIRQAEGAAEFVPAATLKNVNVSKVLDNNKIVFLNMNNYGLYRK